MSMPAPTIPPRPTRSGQTSLKQDMPQLPTPRPHRTDRSVSPNREAYTRSPLNERPPGSLPPIYQSHHRNVSSSDLPIRPPSVQLPSIGHEGDEYANLELHRTTSSSGSGPEQTRAVPADLPMHQPTASVTQATAKSRIQTVTRTDSDQAAYALAKTVSNEDPYSDKHSLRAKASFNRSNPNLLHSRPESINEPEHDHHGIPEIGVQVPMYPNAGDVQAPSPAPSAPVHTAGIGFFNDGSRNHHRRKSSRHEYGPPGSYGMHGHGLEPRDQFEKAWYQRHPEEMAKEKNHQYDPGHPRGEWALSSEDLNKLVHSKRSGVGMGASPNVVSTPDEQIGYLASEQYASRHQTPKPTPLSHGAPRSSSSSHTHAESPLRKTSYPFNEGQNHDAVESDDEHDGVVRVLPPARRTSKYSGGGYDPPTDDLGPRGGNTSEEGGWIEERGYGVPILASDEIAKYPGAGYLQPAIEPEQERGYDSEHHPHYPSSRRTSSRPGSRDKDSSRPSSVHGEPLSRLISQSAQDGSGVGTPLEEIQEYEPLFPEDDDKVEKPVNKAIRPDLARHHFPSQDIWEDNPESLGLTATVSTPDLPMEVRKAVEQSEKPSAVFEHPDVEARRKNGPIASDRAEFMPKETELYANPKFKPGVLQDMPRRPGMQQRFPSQDIWEDNPDSLRLTTTVDSPQDEEVKPGNSPEEPSRTIPSIPARPAKKSSTSPTERRAPTMPDRPKPSVPSRPLPRSSGATPSSPLAAQDGASKPKPAVPSRPAGKLAGIKASFMSDLNSRLQLGPPVAKKEEPKVEDNKEPEPLLDARKGRARGPARRKPASAAAEEETTTTKPASSSSSTAFSISSSRLIFALDPKGALEVYSASNSAPLSLPTTDAEQRSPVPAADVGAEGDLPAPSLGDDTVESQAAITAGLREALADNDANRDAPLGTNSETVSTEPGPEVVHGDDVQGEGAGDDVQYGSGGSGGAGGIGPVKSDKSAAEALQGLLARDQDERAPVLVRLSEVSSGAAGVDRSVQTGETELQIPSAQGGTDRVTAFVDGKVPEEGTVVVKDGREVEGAMQL